MTPFESKDRDILGGSQADVFAEQQPVFVEWCASAGIDPAQAGIAWEQLKQVARDQGLSGEDVFNRDLETLLQSASPEKGTAIGQIRGLARDAWHVAVHKEIFSDHALTGGDIDPDTVTFDLPQPAAHEPDDIWMHPSRAWRAENAGGDSGRISL